MLGFTLKALIDSMRLRFTLNFKTDEELNSNAKWIQVVDQRYATWIVAATTTICKNILKKKNRKWQNVVVVVASIKFSETQNMSVHHNENESRK